MIELGFRWFGNGSNRFGVSPVVAVDPVDFVYVGWVDPPPGIGSVVSFFAPDHGTSAIGVGVGLRFRMEAQTDGQGEHRQTE